MDSDLIYFDYAESEQITAVGVVTHVPRRGWRHRFGKIKMVVANIKEKD